MSERSGFYPSNVKEGIINEYTGYEIGNVYKHLISNGVFATNEGTPSDYLQVVSKGGMNVGLKAGWGIFLNQWYHNDSEIQLTLDTETSRDRIDLIVIEANKSASVLKTYARVLKGTPATVPVAPTPIISEEVAQYPVASIKVTGGLAVITQADITDLRGTAPTLWVTGLIKQLDTSTLWEQFHDAFWTWFNNVKETLVTTTLMRKYTGYTYSTAAGQTEVSVPIPQYNSVLDILQVHIEGRILREGVDYHKNGFTSITLTTGLSKADTQIYFEIFKSVDGSDAESIATLLYQLEDRLGRSIITANDGTSKIKVVSNFGNEIKNAGVGYHTIYVPNTVSGLPVTGKVWRGWSNFTSATSGYVVVVSEDGDVYTINYNGSWGVWRGVYQNTKKMLYTASTGNALAASGTFSPTKALSNCANGWVLHFDNFHYHLPKVRHNGAAWNGEYILIEIPYDMSADGATRSTCMKKIIITDTTITGVEANVLGVNNNVRLWGISEY